MGKNWVKYWKEKGHVRKAECDKRLGIDSFYVRENEKAWASRREDHFVFNNYDENTCSRRINVLISDGEFAFYTLESCFNGVRRTEGLLEEDGFHILVTLCFKSSGSGETIYSRKEQAYIIPLETQKSNGCTFFQCPGKECGKRMRKLYYSNGLFLCRKCLKLGYRSQSINPFDRAKFGISALYRGMM